MDEDDVVVSTLATAATVGAGLLARKLIGVAWAKRRGGVPGEPDADVSWREAATFALVSGAVIGAARMLAQRATVAALVKRTGKEASEAHAPTA